MAMAETARPKTIREMVARYNAVPRGRRVTGYVGAFGGLICFIGIFVAHRMEAGFIVHLGLTFFLCLSGEHYKYAFIENLSQRKVRRMDYWYLSAATIGLFLAAFGYSTQRDTTIARFNEKMYEAGEPSVIATLNESMDSLSKFLCVDFPRAKELCAGLKKVASEIRPGRSPAEITSILEVLEQKVTMPYIRLFPSDEFSKNRNFLVPVITVQIKIEDWKTYAEQAPKVDGIRSKIDDETEILLGVGQWIVWPFLLAYALALRITKVTIDVFEWDR